MKPQNPDNVNNFFNLMDLGVLPGESEKKFFDNLVRKQGHADPARFSGLAACS